jgi:hypothetical protein
VRPDRRADPVVTTPANNGLTYNALTDTYTYTYGLRTDNHWKGKCGTFTLKLDDAASTRPFLFR